jgi:hypothetical protein
MNINIGIAIFIVVVVILSAMSPAILHYLKILKEKKLNERKLKK